jgi:hypothetical protein
MLAKEGSLGLVVCPKQEEYEEFHIHSLAVEGRLLPRFFNTLLSATRLTRRTSGKMSRSNRYCWIDADAVLEKEEWKRFFATKYRKTNGKTFHSQLLARLVVLDEDKQLLALAEHSVSTNNARIM